MKKYIALFLIILCMMSIVGCDFDATSTIPYVDETEFEETSEKNGEDIITPAKTVVDGTAVSGVFDINVSYANWADFSQISTGVINIEKLSKSGSTHYPVYKFDTLDELQSFKKRVDGILTLDEGYDEITASFNEITADYDEAFFAENTLMLVYMESSSCIYRYGVKGVYDHDGTLCIHVCSLNNPDVVDHGMSGWFITVAISDSIVSNFTEFDAEHK